jgi:hypothetical protein
MDDEPIPMVGSPVDLAQCWKVPNQNFLALRRPWTGCKSYRLRLIASLRPGSCDAPRAAVFSASCQESQLANSNAKSFIRQSYPSPELGLAHLARPSGAW